MGFHTFLFLNIFSLFFLIKKNQICLPASRKVAPKKITSLFREAAMLIFCTTVASALVTLLLGSIH